MIIISKLGHHYLSLEKSFEKKYLFYLFINFDPNTIIILRENGRSQPEEKLSKKNRKEQHVTGRKRVIVWTKPFATRRYSRHVIITTSLLFLLLFYSYKTMRMCNIIISSARKLSFLLLSLKIQWRNRKYCRTRKTRYYKQVTNLWRKKMQKLKSRFFTMSRF